MNILNNLKWNGVCFGLCVTGSLLFSRAAAAEVTLVEKDGWTFSFDGRVNAFLSVGFGDDFPLPTPNLADPTAPHTVMGQQGSVGSAGSVADVGWASSVQQKADNKYFGMRVRSGLIGNVLGFGLKRQINPQNYIKAYVSIWSTIETLGRDKWAPVDAEAREGYAEGVGPWGSATLGRKWGLFGRMGAEIDFLYGHGFGVGLPCSDSLGPTCGHTGTGVMYPGYSAGFTYSTPSMGGLQLHAGLYDPVVFAGTWDRAPVLRPEGAVSFETPLGDGKLRLEAEGLYQSLGRVVNTPDPVTMAPVPQDVTTSVWGIAGGGRLEAGPIRLGVSGYRGKGIGMNFALHDLSVTYDKKSAELRSFTGFYGQGALVLGRAHIALGGGVAAADQLPSDSTTNVTESVIQRQIGVSAAFYYHMTDNVVVGLDYFRFMARWYGAPASHMDTATNTQVASGGPPIAGEKQDLNFVNAGVTYHW